MKTMDRSRLKFIIFPLLAIGFLLFSSAPLRSADEPDSAASGSSAEEMMAGLSDEQVRQLLIEELKQDAAVAEAEPKKMKGPAYFLARLLRIMTKGHDDITDEVRALFGAFTTMGPDLYRVFVKL
jgi:hypothetical protein